MKQQSPQKKNRDTVNYHNARVAGLNLEWTEILHMGKRFTFQKNTVIPHETVRGIFYLAKGLVELAYNNVSGHKRIALYYGPGTLINEARTLTGHNPGGTFTCIQPVELYLFNKDICSTDFIVSHPHLVQNLLKTMAVKMLMHYSFVTAMGTGTHLSQLCRFIVSLGSTHDYAKTIPLGITQQEVADLIGVHRATLARLIKKLKELGVVSKFTASGVRVEDFALLEKLAGNG